MPAVRSRGAKACGGSGDSACPQQALVGRSPKQLTLLTFLPAVGHGCSPALRLCTPAAAEAAAEDTRRDLSSGRAGSSEARADPPPPGLPAARLPPRLPSPSLVLSAGNYISQQAARRPAALQAVGTTLPKKYAVRKRINDIQGIFATLRRKHPTPDYSFQKTLRRA